MASNLKNRNESTIITAEGKIGEDISMKQQQQLLPLPKTPTRTQSTTTSQPLHREGGRRSTLLRLVRWIESLHLPPTFLGRRIGTQQHSIPNSTTTSPTTTTSSSNTDQINGIPFISGLERVFFGTQPACETVQIMGISPPRYLCYMLSGSGCDVIQFVIDWILHTIFQWDDPSLCWAFGFGISIIFRHTTHRYLVFGDYVGGYWRSLGRMYGGYSIIIVLSTIFNFIMTHNFHLPHYVAWIITLLWTGIVNYFILKKLWSFGGKEKKVEDDIATTTNTTVNEMDIEGQPFSSFTNDHHHQDMDDNDDMGHPLLVSASSPRGKDHIVEMSTTTRMDRKSLQARKTESRK